MHKVFVINTLFRFFLAINSTAQLARAYRHLVVRDSGTKRDHRAVTVDVDQRLTVGQGRHFNSGSLYGLCIRLATGRAYP